MGPAGKLLNVRQGDRRIEDYARDFMGVARQSAMEKTCLMITFWGGLGEPFRSWMPYWVPEDSLEDYINLALNLSGSAFRVKSTAEPTPVGEPTESAPEPARFREPTESAPDPAPFHEPTESAPEPAPFHEPAESAPWARSVPWAHRVRSVSPLRSMSPQSPLREPAPFREPTESAQEPNPWAHRVRSRARSVPWANAVRSVPGAHTVRSVPGAYTVRSVPEAHTACSVPGAHRALSRMGTLRSSLPLSGALCSTLVASCSTCPALPCPGLLLCLSHPGTRGCLCLQALFHYMGLAPHPSPTLLLPLLDDWERLESVPLRGDYVISPPEVAISLPPGLISLLSIHLSLITPSAVPHYHCLYIPFSLTTLPGYIVFMHDCC